MARLNVNGAVREFEAEGDTPLLWVLREQLGLTGTKYGCGIAACGACTVHVDGVPTRSCVRPVSTVEATAKIVLWGCGCFPIALWLARRNDTTVGAMVGMGNGMWRGAALGLGATLPMIAALFVLPLKGFDLDLALGSGVFGPFAEELLFRGFLFGLLWRGAGWSPFASIVASSLLFGLAHLPRADF